MGPFDSGSRIYLTVVLSRNKCELFTKGGFDWHFCSRVISEIHGKFQAFTIFLFKTPFGRLLVNIIVYPITQKLYLWELSYKKAARWFL